MDINNLELIKKGGFTEIYQKGEVVYKLGPLSHRDILWGQFNLLRELDDPHFPLVYDWLKDDESCGFTMELLKASTINELFQKVPKRKKDFDRLKRILLNILDAISLLHSRGIIHGDLKPSHIFIDEDDNIKIIDPGYDPDIITPLYAAPEAIMGEPSEASDIYSIGIILYETITGERPFTGSLQKIVHSKLVEDLVQPSQLNPSIPEDLDGLIQRMVSRRLDWRLKKVSDVWRQLEIGLSENVISVSFLPVFVGRNAELKDFGEMMNRLPESHILWVVGDMGMGKTQFLNRCRTTSLMKGLSVKELSCGELYKLLEMGEFPGEPIILLVDEPERVETLPGILKQNAEKIRHNPLIILITSEKEPEEISELADITTILSLSPLKKKEIGDICDRNFPKLKNRDALISFITERTNGIPLLINQTLRYLSDEGIIGRKGEKWVFKEEEARDIPFSPDIKELLKFQVENLLDDEGNLLKVCSVFPERIPLSFLQRLGVKNPYSIIESLVIKRLLVKNEGIIQFSNKWIQELLYQSLKKEEKRKIYKGIIEEEQITDPEVIYPLQIELGMKKEALGSLNQAIKERIKQRDYPAAIELLQKILSLKADKQKRMVLARLLELVGRYKEALELYERFLKGDPNNPCFLLRLGANQRRIGLRDQAEKNLRLTINKASGFYKQRAIYELGRLFLEEHKIDDASRLLSGITINKESMIPELHYLAAHIAYIENKPDDVIRICSEVLNKRLSAPLKKAFLAALGLAKQKKEEYEESIDYFDSALTIERELKDRANEAINLMNKGFSLLQLDQYRKAISDIESALSIFQSARMRDMEARAIWNLSVLYLRMGFWDKLEERIHQFEERYGDIDSLLKEGLVYIGMYRGDYADVERLILELKKEDESTEEFQALLSSYKGEWEIAEGLFKKAVEEVRGNRRKERDVHLNLSEVLYNQGKREEAISLLKPYMKEISKIKSDFEKANLLSSWGLIKNDSSSIKEAIQLFASLDLPFYTGRAYFKLGAISYKEDLLEDAVSSLRKAEEIFLKLGAKGFLSRTRELLSECAERLAGSRGYIRTYGEISRLLASLDSEKRFDEALSILARFFSAERGAIILKEDEKNIIISSYNIDRTTLKDATKISSTITRQTEKGEVIISVDAKEDERFRELDSVNRNQIRSILCVPITAEERIYGVLYLDSTIKKELFLPRDKEFLQSMGRFLGILFSKGDLLYRLKDENIQLKKMTRSKDSFHSIIGISEPMQEIYDIIEETAPLDINILITGETGTGKELIARTLHQLSKRNARPFVTVDCSSLTETLLQSELFGHKKGSFTGAMDDKQGMCEVANGGTLFLDEIGDAPLSIQAGLLHITDRGELRRVGETKWRKVDLRIISATNKDIDQAILVKEFRDDLFYRLNHIAINIPPLRERREDIPLFLRHYLRLYSEKKGKKVEGFTDKAMGLLKKYPWPGNVRELIHTIELSLIKTRGPLISRDDLPDKFKDEIKEELPDWDQIQSRWKRESILQVMDETNGNIAEAARKLHISRRHLYRLLDKFQITR